MKNDLIRRLITIFLTCAVFSSIILARGARRTLPFFTHRSAGVTEQFEVVNKEITDNRILMELRLTKTSPSIGYHNSKTVKLDIKFVDKETINIVFNSGNPKFELPKKEPFPYHRNFANLMRAETDFEFDIQERPFSLTIKRKSTNEVIFTTKNSNIVIADPEQYTELSTVLPTKYLYGLGERTTNMRLQSGVYTIYNKDAYGDLEDRKGGHHKYGSHPMYLMREASGNWHINYLRNGFPMDAVVDQEKNTLTYKIAGGVLDFSIFLGDKTPEGVTKRYHAFLGNYTLPPFWSMGFHQCRWGYKSLSMIQEVLKNYADHKLPLDTIWADIDYMDDYMPFTVDETRFNLKEFQATLDQYKKKFVLIAEPSMGIKWPNYELFVKGKEKDLYIKNKEGEYLINKVWPGKCYFIDYFNPQTPAYWDEALDSLHNKLDFSGIWLDMNEIAAFSPGQIDINENVLSCNDDTKYPYLPGGKPFESNTICPNAQHYGGLTQIQVHNYYPVQQQMLTFNYLSKKFPDQYPFILTRANAAGTGKYSAHWTGDNVGNFNFYKLSITETMNFNLFGVPMSGADICGFGDNTPEILCAKWYQMGSLYPFSRSHSHLDAYRKEPYAMGETLLETTRKSLNFRYTILKHYYSLFIASKGTGAIFKPVFFEFSDDVNTLEDNLSDNQFMIGAELMVVPNTNDNDKVTLVSAYFPDIFYDLRYNTKVEKGHSNVDAVLKEMPPVFLRSGKTIFTNNADNVHNSYDLDNHYNFIVALDTSNSSTGRIPALSDYNSKSKIESCMDNDCFMGINTHYDVNTKALNVNISKANNYDGDFKFFNISSIRIYGMNAKDLTIKESNLDELIENNVSLLLPSASGKYKLQYVNDNYFIIQMNGSLKVHKDNVSISIIFE